MSTTNLSPAELRLTIAPDSLGFTDTSELVDQTLSWIGQERAETAAHFGLGMAQRDYNLFVLGEVGSGRTSLLKQAMQSAAGSRSAPPDLCYLYNFDAPERPVALRLPAGQGRQLRELMGCMVTTLQTEIPLQLDGQDFKLASEHIEKSYKDEEIKAYAILDAFAESHQFTLHRKDGHMVFTVLSEKGKELTDIEILALPKEQRAEIELAEQAMRIEINRYSEKIRPMARTMGDALDKLQKQVVKPLLEQSLQEIRVGLKKKIKDSVKLGTYLNKVMQDVLNNLLLFGVAEADDDLRKEALAIVLSRYRVNLVVDNDVRTNAPVIIEDNPLFRQLFGSIEYRSENEILMSDFFMVRAGSLHKAHGGYLMLHLRDVLADSLVWEKLRRFLRCGRLQIEEPGTALSPIAAVSMQPEAVDVDVKIILVGSRELYYELQEGDPEFSRHFRVKVDFAESFAPSLDSRRASAIFISHTCRNFGLPHFSAAAVARLLEDAHRDVDDQSRQSAIFARAEALVMESASLCDKRAGKTVSATDVDAALLARIKRNDYPEQSHQESITDGDQLINVQGSKVGQLNALTVIDLGDYSFGFPVRLSARTHAGEDGLVNIAREVEMSGPIHDKGVLILQNYLSSLFTRNAPLALNASIVFEQEYSGVEGDSASCAELYVLLSSLSGLPLKQGIAVTGAVNQHGEVLPVGGINDKIEGYFKVCEKIGLDGSQGVLIPHRNRRHLMLDQKVVDAVEQGLFHVHTVEHIISGIEFLTDVAAGTENPAGDFPPGSVLGQAQKTLYTYRRACQESSSGKVIHKHLN